MPFKLIGTIILLILVTIFAGVNLDNKCDITFVFYTFKDIPVFMTVIISFAIGAILMLPFTLGRKKKKNCPKAESKNTVEVKEQAKQAPATESKTLFDFKIKREAKSGESKKEKKPLFGKKAKSAEAEKKSESTSDSPESNAETGTPV